MTLERSHTRRARLIVTRAGKVCHSTCDVAAVGEGGGGLFLLDTTAAARVSKRLRSEDVLPMSCRGHPESEDESPTSLDERPNLEVVSSMSYNERLNSKQAAPILRSECLVSEPVSMLPRNERC